MRIQSDYVYKVAAAKYSVPVVIITICPLITPMHFTRHCWIYLQQGSSQDA